MFCDRLYFAAPKGLISVAEIPDRAGLIEWTKTKGWQTARAPGLMQLDERVPYRLAMALLMHYKPAPWAIPHPDRYERLRQLARGQRSERELGNEIACKLQEAELCRTTKEQLNVVRSLLRRLCPDAMRWMQPVAMAEWLVQHQDTDGSWVEPGGRA